MIKQLITGIYISAFNDNNNNNNDNDNDNNNKNNNNVIKMMITTIIIIKVNLPWERNLYSKYEQHW